MTPGDWLFFAVVAALGTNHVILRLPGWEQRPLLFWLVQGLNLGAAVFLLTAGLPGFDGDLQVVNYVIALLFVIRTVQNNNRWGKRAARRAESTDASRRDAISAALKRGSQEHTPSEE